MPAPIHRLQPKTPEQRRKPWLASDRTWCGADAYRRGVKVEGVNAGDSDATCPACLNKQAEADAEAEEEEHAEHLRHLAGFDRWEAMCDRERELEIRTATRRAS